MKVTCIDQTVMTWTNHYYIKVFFHGLHDLHRRIIPEHTLTLQNGESKNRLLFYCNNWNYLLSDKLEFPFCKLFIESTYIFSEQSEQHDACTLFENTPSPNCSYFSWRTKAIKHYGFLMTNNTSTNLLGYLRMKRG